MSYVQKKSEGGQISYVQKKNLRGKNIIYPEKL
jgi:hypothetical protein